MTDCSNDNKYVSLQHEPEPNIDVLKELFLLPCLLNGATKNLPSARALYIRHLRY